MQGKWRFIPPLAAPGAIQMAIDEWLLEQHLQGKMPSVLRFYTWYPPAISLGYHQRRYPDFWRELTWQGKPLDLVRRPTGGRAVLHQGDLTYMVVTSGIPGTRSEVYEYICQFLLEGWRSLGVQLSYGKKQGGYLNNPNCFATTTVADLINTSGQKLIGSAQLRRGKAILQHGSIILARDSELYQQVFGDSALEEIKLPLFLEGQELIDLLTQKLTEAACRCFQMELYSQPLLETEWEEILSLVRKEM